MFIAKCKGEGQSTCTNCSGEGRWSLTWTSFLYRIKGFEGRYCWDCVKKYADNIKEAIILVDDFKERGVD